jgi:hypothetical protein
MKRRHKINRFNNMLAQKIDRLLKFLPGRIAKPFDEGEFKPSHGTYSYSKELLEFRAACHEFSSCFVFEWVEHIDELDEWKIEEASLEQLGKLLFVILQQDRFISNNFYGFSITEESLRFLQRLKLVATPEAIAEVEEQIGLP